MSLQDVADKVYKRYGGTEGNLESLAASIARWTLDTYDDALKALGKSRNNIIRNN